MTRVFIVGTVIDAPSTVSVTVLCAATANPPAKVSASNVAPTNSRNMRRARFMKLVQSIQNVVYPD